MKKKGIYKNCYHVDRIVETLGYIEGNLQILEGSKNQKKYWIHYRRTKTADGYNFKTEIHKPDIDDYNDIPF